MHLAKYCFIALLLMPGALFAQAGQSALKEKINSIIDTAGGKFGIGV
jgi:hypothetical protein